MSYLEWTNALDVGIEEMNAEHQRLIGLMNTFHERSQSGGSRAEALQALTALGEFTTKHFAHEEQVMANMGFPDLEKHARLHKKLLASFAEHAKDFEKTGKADELLMFLKVWLKSHIMGLDTKYGQHANAAA